MTHPASGNPTWQDYPNTSTPVTAASLESIENALDSVAGARIGFQARSQPSNQTIAGASVWTAVNLTQEDYDDDNGHSTSTNTGRWVAARARRYRVSACALWADAFSMTNPRRSARLVKNGTQIPNTQVLGSYPGVFYSMVIPTVLVDLAVGDYVELQVLTAAAGAVLYGTAVDGSIMTIELA